MALRSSLGTLSLALLASLSAIACSSSGPTANGGSGAEQVTGGDEDVEQSEDALGASCTYSRKWFASLRDRPCEPVAGYRGTWWPSSLFEETRDDESTCTYTWQGERYSRADQTALQGSVEYGEGLAPACGPGKNPIEGELYQIEQMDVIGMAGGVGCDVCGILRRNDRINVILPPGRLILKQVAVKLSNGESRSFQLEAPEGARAVTYKLPAPPAGTYYVSSKLTVY